MLYQILKHLHSGLRWVVLILLVGAVVNALIKLLGKKEFRVSDKKVNLITMSVVHTQFLIGLILYFVSPKVIFSAESMSNRMLRFYLVEHIGMMILVVVLLTVGYSMSKKVEQDYRKHRRIFIFYFLSLLILLAGIPWPWMNLTSGWI